MSGRWGWRREVRGAGWGRRRVIARGPVAGAFAGLAIGVNGLVTAVLAPVLAMVSRRW